MGFGKETPACRCTCGKVTSSASDPSRHTSVFPPSQALILDQRDSTVHTTTQRTQLRNHLSNVQSSSVSEQSSVSAPVVYYQTRSTGVQTCSESEVDGYSLASRNPSPGLHSRLLLHQPKNRNYRKSSLGRVSKKYKKSRMHRVKKEEYKKLREMVPALQEKNKVSKVVVIEETAKYIDELHSALIQRFRAKGLPASFNGVRLEPWEIHRGNIRDLVRRLLANANPSSLPPSRIENVRTVPSFIQKVQRLKRS